MANAPDKYAVFGHPIKHSRSPEIHAAFAEQTRQNLEYGKIEAPLDDFSGAVSEFVAQGGQGFNVTVPFKNEAWNLCDDLSVRAQYAGAVNTVSVQADGQLKGDNTDGAGLVADIVNNLRWTLENKRVLIIGAGGAVQGVLEPILKQAPAQLHIVNRTAEKAEALAAKFASEKELSENTAITGGTLESAVDGYDVIINGSSASLAGGVPAVLPSIISEKSCCYDMMYSKDITPFNGWCQQQGAAAVADGLGMLVEQAAEAFYVWRGTRPDTSSILSDLR